MGVCEQWYNILAVIVMLLPLCTGELVDISQYAGKIVDRHNEIRRAVGASDMWEMQWDDGLSKAAGEWLKYCKYERAPSHISDCGQNLHYSNHFVQSWSVGKAVNRAITSWESYKVGFVYGMNCGSACTYSQIIWSTATRVGCAMNTCYRMMTGPFEKRHTTMFACFYSPKGEMTNGLPYTPGLACTMCPVGSRCREGLCRVPELQAQNLLGPEVAPGVSGVDNIPARVPAVEPPIVVPSMCFANMTTQEVHFILLVTNNLRVAANVNPVTWSDELEQWAAYVIRCDIEYPGPRTAYTNFGKTGLSTPLYQLVYEWDDEQTDTLLSLYTGGCRTPNDVATCNHKTNMMAITNTRMGCAACSCGLQRQLTCIYAS